jgi:hypothetical protein
MLELLLIFIGLVVVIFYIPVTEETVNARLTAEGYQYVNMLWRNNPWYFSGFVNHVNLKERSKVRVFACFGYISVKIV